MVIRTSFLTYGYDVQRVFKQPTMFIFSFLFMLKENEEYFRIGLVVFENIIPKVCCQSDSAAYI